MGPNGKGFKMAGRGNGYDGYSMSNNARTAYDQGEMPKSKWTKQAIIDALTEEFTDELTQKALKLVTKSTLSCLLERTSWHHTSSKYNRTDFYSVAHEFGDDADVIIWCASFLDDGKKTHKEIIEKAAFLTQEKVEKENAKKAFETHLLTAIETRKSTEKLDAMLENDELDLYDEVRYVIYCKECRRIETEEKIVAQKMRGLAKLYAHNLNCSPEIFGSLLLSVTVYIEFEMVGRWAALEEALLTTSDFNSARYYNYLAGIENWPELEAFAFNNAKNLPLHELANYCLATRKARWEEIEKIRPEILLNSIYKKLLKKMS